ncbi:hypothetical protein HID58_087199 [Brassica napus]|uniref:Uncharacterized protein n=1 Tax=Brassica napus TaxID=3708 RepID=A0ABQ7XSN0_BRANA|nr:hypothetical protein HID58_087199 [Brassica napus]
MRYPPVSEHYFLETSRFPRINLQVQQDQHMKPLRALDSREESLGTTSSYTMIVRKRTGLHASTKGLVPPKEGMRKIAVFTRLLPRTELLHPRVRVYVLQNIILRPISNHGAHKKEVNQ